MVNTASHRRQGGEKNSVGSKKLKGTYLHHTCSAKMDPTGKPKSMPVHTFKMNERTGDCAKCGVAGKIATLMPPWMTTLIASPVTSLDLTHLFATKRTTKETDDAGIPVDHRHFVVALLSNYNNFFPCSIPIATVILAGCNLNDNGLREFQNILVNNTTITALDLRENNFTFEVSMTFLNAIEHVNYTLCNLQMKEEKDAVAKAREQFNAFTLDVVMSQVSPTESDTDTYAQVISRVEKLNEWNTNVANVSIESASTC